MWLPGCATASAIQSPSSPRGSALGEQAYLGLAPGEVGPGEVARRPERRAQGEPEVDGLLACVARLRQMREGRQRLLEVPHGLAVGRSRHVLLPRLPAVGHRFLPYLTSQGVVGQSVNLFGLPVIPAR